METPSSSAEHATEWERYVGKAILRFGDIELVSIRLLAVAQSEKSLNSISREGFSDRASKLINLLESQNQLNESESALLKNFSRAKQLAQKRNLIAHNPMMLDIYINKEETDMYVEHSIRSVRSDEDFLDLPELKEFSDEVERLSSDIWLHYCKIMGDPSDLWRLRDFEDSHK